MRERREETKQKNQKRVSENKAKRTGSALVVQFAQAEGNTRTARSIQAQERRNSTQEEQEQQDETEKAIKERGSDVGINNN